MSFKLCSACGAVLTEKAEACPVCGGRETTPLRMPPKGEAVPVGKKRPRLDLQGLTVVVAVFLVLVFAALPFLLPKLEAASADTSAADRFTQLYSAAFPDS